MGTDSRKLSVSRTGNDHIYNVLWGVVAEDGAFRCECNDSCIVEVLMRPSEYVRLRDRGEFVYAPGHDGAIPQNV